MAEHLFSPLATLSPKGPSQTDRHSSYSPCRKPFSGSPLPTASLPSLTCPTNLSEPGSCLPLSPQLRLCPSIQPCPSLLELCARPSAWAHFIWPHPCPSALHHLLSEDRGGPSSPLPQHPRRTDTVTASATVALSSSRTKALESRTARHLCLSPSLACSALSTCSVSGE